MTVISLAIYEESDPNGTSLATLSDADLESFEMRVAENELGSGLIKIDRANAAVQYLVGGNYIKVTIPVISASPIFGFWLNNADDEILAANEEGGEYLTRGGPGTLAVLGRALLLDQFYNGSLGGDARGNTSIDGFWTWTAEPYGAILVRLIEEGQLEPGTPLEDVTIDFNRTDDSNGDAWPNVIETVQVDIGTDGLGLYERLVATGNLFVYPEPDLTIHGYGTPPGVNRTSATFATNKIRFEKGINIETELIRTDEGRPATHALVKGKDLVYRHVVSTAYTSGRAKWIAIDYPESNDPDLLDAVGAHELARQQLISDQTEFAIYPGDSWTQGRYLPFKHFALGDLATLHTGSGASDFNELSTRIVGIKIVLNDASDDATDDLAAKSLTVVIEANGGPTYGGLGRRDPGVNVPNGCAPCPGDFPYVPNGGHFFEGDFVMYGDNGPDIPADGEAWSFPNGAILAASTDYDYHFEWDDDGHLYSRHIGVQSGGPNNIGDSGANVAFGLEPADEPGVTSEVFAGTFTTPDAAHFNAASLVYVLTQAAATPHDHLAHGTLSFWIDPVGWSTAGTPPAAGQAVGPEIVVMSGVDGTTAHPFADGSLHVFYDGQDQTAAIVSYDGAARTFVMAGQPLPGWQVTVTYVKRPG